MQEDRSRRSAGGAEIGLRLPSGLGRSIMCLALCLTAAGCAEIGQALGPALGPSVPARAGSIAFESIDGLPSDLSLKLVGDLKEAAAALRIAVAPAGSGAAYRMRGYLAAHTQGSATSIAWAWDVYDAELHRAFRLSGEERAGGGANAGRNPWAGADDALLRAIARAGMEQLAGFMAAETAPAVPPAPPPVRDGSEVVASREDGPGVAREAFLVPLPQPRPAQAASPGTTRLADATWAR